MRVVLWQEFKRYFVAGRPEFTSYEAITWMCSTWHMYEDAARQLFSNWVSRRILVALRTSATGGWFAMNRN